MYLVYRMELWGVVRGSMYGWIRVHGCMGAHAYVFIHAWILVGGDMDGNGVTGKVSRD